MKVKRAYRKMSSALAASMSILLIVSGAFFSMGCKNKSGNNQETAALLLMPRTGQISWYTFLGGFGCDDANSIRQTSDGGYIVAGSGANIPSLQGKAPLNAYCYSDDMMVVKLKGGR